MGAPVEGTDFYGASEAGLSFAAALDEHLALPNLSLPVAAASAARLRSVLAAPQVPEQALADAVGRDPAALASVLREANRREYDALPPIAEPVAAVARLGRDRTQEILGSLLADAELGGGDVFTAEALDRVWRRSLLIALFAGEVAQRWSDAGLVGALRVLGVLSEAGAVFLLASLQSIRATRNEFQGFTPAARNEVLCELQDRYTLRLLAGWRLPPGVVDVIAGRVDDRVARRKTQILALARLLAASIGATPVGCDAAHGDECDELWDLADVLELGHVDVAALQVRGEMLLESIDAAPAGSA
jgi:HD-like signal output (HDOD) protein